MLFVISLTMLPYLVWLRTKRYVWWIMNWKGFDGSGHDLFEILFRHFPRVRKIMQNPAQWVLGLFCWVQSGRGLKLTTHYDLMPRSRMAELCLHSSKCHVLMVKCLIKPWEISHLPVHPVQMMSNEKQGASVQVWIQFSVWLAASMA
jgi:hypothetical protein